MATLQTLLADTRRLLHDGSSTYFSDTDLTRWINEGLRQRDRDTSKNRKVVNGQLKVGINFYTFTTDIDPNAYDLISLVVLYGNRVLEVQPEAYTVARTLYQPYPTFQQVPQVFARYGASQIYLAPAPLQTYTVEWDVCVTSVDLVNPTDPDVLPGIWSEPVPYWAAHVAKTQLQQTNKSQEMLNEYQRRISDLLNSSFQLGRLAPPAGAPWRRR